jgi:hypothetical protein
MAGCGVIPGLICFLKNFDRNPRVRFHKGMVVAALQKSAMLSLAHSLP